MPIVDGSLDRLMPKTLHIPSVASKKAAYILTLQPKKVKFFIVKSRVGVILCRNYQIRK